MSPVSKSKSKDKRASKEPLKAFVKPSGHTNAGGGIPSSGYNPLLGTFHTLETAQSSAPPLHANGRFRNIDETDDHSGNSFGTGVEYDCVSNNGSWSGESEDHKEKITHPPPRQEAIPGAENDKREKIRQKNEKKHQRQKERRAQELHERCCGYLMSRKLEALAQQLVAMGFSSEQATMALILNEGRVEESVAWLFEGCEEVEKQREHSLDAVGNLKLDISEELTRIADMENKYKCSKQEVERALLASEGDLEKAEETLRVQKQEPPPAPPKPEEIGDPPSASNDKLPVAVSQNLMRAQAKSTSSSTIQQKSDEKDFNYTKINVTAGSSGDPGSKNMSSVKRIQPNVDWTKPQQIGVLAEKRWPTTGSNHSVSYSLASPLQACPPPAKTETRYMAVGNEIKNLQLGSVKEPVIMMQRPQSMNAKRMSTTSISSTSPPGTAAGKYPNVETTKTNGLTPHISGTRMLSSNNVNTNQLYNQLHQHQQQYVSSSSLVDAPGTGRGSRTGTPTTLAAASSLGLFSGLGSNGSSGSSSPVGWNTSGSALKFDYSNIDWSLDLGSSPSRPGGMWLGGMGSFMQNGSSTYDPYNYGPSVKTAMRPVISNGNGVSIGGLPNGIASAETSAGGSLKWSSPFEEKDISVNPGNLFFLPL